MSYQIKYLTKINSKIDIPADKSISHRAAILASLAQGETKLENFLDCDDTRATLDCLRKLGVEIDRKAGRLLIKGVGKYFPRPKNQPLELYADESGTTMRILSGPLAGQKFSTRISGASSLNRRPMARIIRPLRMMGASIEGKDNIYPPLLISPARYGIDVIDYQSPIASAQIKSAIMLAALYAKGKTTIVEPYQSRDHSERMLKLFKVKVEVKEKEITCPGVDKLISPGTIQIPGDFSSAAFFIVLALILKDSELLIRGVNINPSRCGLLKVLARMGAKIKLENQRKV